MFVFFHLLWENDVFMRITEIPRANFKCTIRYAFTRYSNETKKKMKKSLEDKSRFDNWSGATVPGSNVSEKNFFLHGDECTKLRFVMSVAPSIIHTTRATWHSIHY